MRAVIELFLILVVYFAFIFLLTTLLSGCSNTVFVYTPDHILAGILIAVFVIAVLVAFIQVYVIDPIKRWWKNGHK